MSCCGNYCACNTERRFDNCCEERRHHGHQGHNDHRRHTDGPHYFRYTAPVHHASSKPGNPAYTWKSNAGFPNIPTRSDYFYFDI